MGGVLRGIKGKGSKRVGKVVVGSRGGIKGKGVKSRKGVGGGVEGG